MLQYEYTEKVKKENSELVITNLGSLAHKIRITTTHPGNGLQINFENARGDGTCYIQITPGEILLGRTIFRPNHDHNDSEQLYVVDGKIQWVNRWPYGQKVETLKFGSETVNY